MNRSRSMWRWIFLLCFARIAIAQDSIPTDADLHTAYCIPVLTYWVEFYGQLEQSTVADEKTPRTPEFQAMHVANIEMARELVASAKSELNRLQMSSRPRAQYRDSTALVAATKLGEADIQQFKMNNDRCVKECSTETIAKISSCSDSCVGKDMVERVRACNNPKWLPF